MYWPTGTSLLPMARNTSPDASSSASRSKDSMPLGLPSGTARVTLFSSRSSRVALSTKSRPSVFSAPPSASSWFICLGAAEMNTSQSALSWIWVFSVPEES